MDQTEYTFQNLIVATDGSEKAKQSFLQAVEMFGYGNLFQTIHVIHVSNKNKTYLAKNHTTQHIEQEYKSELISRFLPTRYDLAFQEKGETFTHSRDQILDLCTALKGDFLFLGYSGRKGVKNDPTVLSQTVRGVAFSQILPLVIIKDIYIRKNTKTGGFTFLVGLDGSKKSFKCLQKTVGLANHPNDQVLPCFVPNPNKISQVSEMREQVQNYMKELNYKNWQFMSLYPNYDASEEIINYVNLTDNNIGNNGYRAEQEEKAFIGQSAERIISKIIANPIIIT